MRVVKTVGAILATYFVVNFIWAAFAISTNSKYKAEIKNTVRLIYTSQIIALVNMKDLTSLLIKDTKHKIYKEKTFKPLSSQEFTDD